MITEQTIKNEFDVCLEKAKGMFSNWKTEFSSLNFETPKSKSGMAFTDGTIQISPAFIGTSAYNKLRKTIFHEIAHLIVGIEQGHNNRFKFVLMDLTQDIDVSAAENQQILDNANYPYRLLGFGVKRIYDLGGAFRRTKKYKDYKPSNSFHSILGDKITRYEYVPYSEQLPENTFTEADL